MKVLIGVDIGTYSVKAIAITAEGEWLDSASCRHDVSIIAPGYAEQDADKVWWKGLVKVVRDLIAGGSFKKSDICALGVSTLSPCVTALDANDRPLRPAILYGMDVRAGRQIERFNRELGDEMVLSRYGQRMSSQTAGPKILWIKDNQPEIFEKARRFVPATTYIVHRLTGRWTLDRYVAPSYAPFFRIDTMEWDEEMIQRYLGTDKILDWPKILWSAETAGNLTYDASEETGLPSNIPVITGSADALAEAVSGAAIKPGSVFIMYGSSIIFIATTKEAIVSSDTFWPSPGMIEGEWALAGGMSTSGSLVRWIMDTFYGKDATFDEFFQNASKSPPGSNGLIMLPYFSGERTPISDPDARGIIMGMSLKHNIFDISRAALEGVAFGIRHNIEEYEKVLGPVELIGAGGGVTDPFWAQIISDVCGKPQRIMAHTNAAVGDALMAGMAVGLMTYDEMNLMATGIGNPQTIVPQTQYASVYNLQFDIYKELYTSTGKLNKRMADFMRGEANGNTDF